MPRDAARERVLTNRFFAIFRLIHTFFHTTSITAPMVRQAFVPDLCAYSARRRCNGPWNGTCYFRARMSAA